MKAIPNKITRMMRMTSPGFERIEAYTARKIQFTCMARELCGLNPHIHIYVSVSDLYIPRIRPHLSLEQNRQTNPGNI
jgi:hypothetical protein